MTVGERIKSIRVAALLSQEEFAGKLGIGRRTVQMIEADESVPRVSTVSMICQVFGVRREWLLTGEGGIEDTDGYVDRRLASWLTIATEEQKTAVLALISTPGALETMAAAAEKLQELLKKE